MTHFKTTLAQLAFITAISFFTTSCSDNQKAPDTKDVAEEHNDAKFDKTKNEKDAQFLVNAAEINLEEIALGQLAQKNGTLTDVKTLGKMMEESHTKSLNALIELAKKKQITVPTAPTDKGQEAYKSLSEKSGNDFDKKYCDMMVDGHKDAISLFEKAATESTDMDIKDWATATLPELRAHLDHSITCQKKCEKM